MIFAREIDDSLTGLVKKIDAATAEHKNDKMGSFVVFTTDDEDLEKKLKDLAEKEGIKDTVFTIDNPAGPKGMKLDKEAAVTVVLYKDKEVKVSRAFKKGELTSQEIDKVLKDLPKILE
jgi:predicted transcriptional regulator